MSQFNVRRVPRLTDGQVLRIWQALFDKHEGGTMQFRLPGGISIKQKELEARTDYAFSYSIHQATFTNPANTIIAQFSRGISDEEFTKRRPSIHFDEIQISRNGRDPVDSDQMLAVLDTIEAEVPKIPIRYGDDETSSVSDFMGTQFAQLTALVTKMASQFDDRQSDLDKYRATLDDEHKTRMEELEETFKL